MSDTNTNELKSRTVEEVISALPEGYEERMEAYLKQIGVEFKFELVGNDCPRWCEQYGQPGAGEFPRKGHMHGKHYLATFRRPAFPAMFGGSYEGLTDKLKAGAYKAFTVDFWNSYHDEEFNWLRGQRWALDGMPRGGKDLLQRHGLEPSPSAWKSWKYVIDGQVKWMQPSPKLPTPYGVISCLEKDEPDTDFEQWASDFGYGPDSRRAEATWKACLEQWTKVRGFFTEGELEVLREIGQ